LFLHAEAPYYCILSRKKHEQLLPELKMLTYQVLFDDLVGGEQLVLISNQTPLQ